MRYQPALLIYTCLLLTGLASAGLTGWVERPAFLSAQWLLPVAGLALLGAAYLLSLMAAGVMFPTAWRQQRMNQDHQLIWKNFPRTNRRGPRMSWWVHGMIQQPPRPT
ncbi:MAG: hypothetical protein OEW12_09520, partial [Deltaproteobacteria bacterium]|nr:hypothetical protein [Deltaproteobacteria bacterium]